MWKYFENNIGTRKVVAEFYNEKEVHILNVYEYKKFYYTDTLHYFLMPIYIPYTEIGKTEGETTKLHPTIKWLIKACDIIEKDYNLQVEKIKNII